MNQSSSVDLCIHIVRHLPHRQTTQAESIKGGGMDANALNLQALPNQLHKICKEPRVRNDSPTSWVTNVIAVPAMGDEWRSPRFLIPVQVLERGEKEMKQLATKTHSNAKKMKFKFSLHGCTVMNYFLTSCLASYSEGGDWCLIVFIFF